MTPPSSPEYWQKHTAKILYLVAAAAIVAGAMFFIVYYLYEKNP